MIKKNIYLLSFYIAIVISIIAMFYFINQKEGWHEDEIFSYGSSNYVYDNLFQPNGKQDAVNKVVWENILDKNIFKTTKKAFYYISNSDEFIQKLNSEKEQEHPVWKTAEEAKKYVTVNKNSSLNYSHIYYNQSRDAHPPLFYILVHTISFFFKDIFSKYIIFGINTLFFILTCFIIRKILNLFKKDYLIAFTILLYGLSMGGISSVLYQRMYMMLTFFVIYYLYINIKIAKHFYEIDSFLKIQSGITTLLGFLTHYYFCVYALIILIINLINMYKLKLYRQAKEYIMFNIKVALIGIILFPASIYHIFFSYRGISSVNNSISYFQALANYLKIFFNAYSLSTVFGYIIFFACILLLVSIYIKNKKRNIINLFIIPVVIYVLIITRIAPYIQLRYIMCILPIISLCLVLALDNIIRKRNIKIIIISIATLIILIYGLICNSPDFLYKGYSKYLNIAVQNKHASFVYVGDNVFNHIQSIEEFMIYNKSLILNENQLELLKNNEILNQKPYFILAIKKYKNVNELLEKVIEYTGYSNHELLLDDTGDVGNILYKMTRE